MIADVTRKEWDAVLGTLWDVGWYWCLIGLAVIACLSWQRIPQAWRWLRKRSTEPSPPTAIREDPEAWAAFQAEAEERRPA